MPVLELLKELRAHAGNALTTGLDDATIEQFCERDPQLVSALENAQQSFQQLRDQMPDFLHLSEVEQIQTIQQDYVNFYAEDAVNPYVALAANGPWIVTLKGAVLHDNGGYGMLGFGHAPSAIIDSMSQPYVMANVMTPNISQLKLVNALRKEIGHSREAGCPFKQFLCLNSGSEAVTVAARISDINAKNLTDPNGRHAYKPIKTLGLKGAFHGRTDRPARFSDSTRKTYAKYLASFRDQDNLITVEPNDLEQLEQVYEYANKNNIFIEAFFMEPVMGEGNPGQAITPEFYKLARQLTQEHGSLLLIDSIQAGLRAHGVLSICDYPGFEDAAAPDMETYSKALNGGQYPLSVLAMSESAAGLYKKGVYGNTMTTNPRALEVACTVLDLITPELRENIRQRGQDFLDQFETLKTQMGGDITKVQGTGLLFSIELDPRFKSYGAESIEEFMRMHGINVIHGGENSLRYTPHFAITAEEVELIVAATKQALLNGPVQVEKSEAA